MSALSNEGGDMPHRTGTGMPDTQTRRGASRLPTCPLKISRQREMRRLLWTGAHFAALPLAAGIRAAQPEGGGLLEAGGGLLEMG